MRAGLGLGLVDSIFTSTCCSVSQAIGTPSFVNPRRTRRALTRTPKRFLHGPYASLLTVAGGGVGGGPPLRMSTSSGQVEASSPTSNLVGPTTVPDFVVHNGETLRFGDYRRPSLVESSAITISAIGVVLWRAFVLFRRLRRTWAKALVAVAIPPVAWALRSFTAYIYRQTVLAPKLNPPERVAFRNSRFQNINGMKVHALWEKPRTSDSRDAAPRTVLHMNHGFGASGLSWSPVISKLSQGLDAVAVAHDTPGFGLTDRPGIWKADRYSLDHNAALTRQMVDVAQRGTIGSATADTNIRRRLVLMGHSMGCITAATVALDPDIAPEDVTLVLVAPALPALKNRDGEATLASGQGSGEEEEDLVVRGGSGDGETTSGNCRAALRAFCGGVRRVVRWPFVWVFNWCILPLFYPAEVLVLRTLVYRGEFWRAALRRSAWFDKDAVNTEVINRYRWPSLVRNWERGMALFLLNRLQVGRGGAAGPPGVVEALIDKASRGMKVVIVQGDNDQLVQLDGVRRTADIIPGAELIVLPRCGHVPHEEKPHEFVRSVLESLGRDVVHMHRGGSEVKAVT